MAESECNRTTRRFEIGRYQQTFEIRRSELLPVLKHASGFDDSTLLTIVTREHEVEDLNDKRTRATVWWRKNGTQVDAAVTEILQRLQRPKEGRS